MAAQPSIDDINKAAILEDQLTSLNAAIAVLDQKGSALGAINCVPPPPDPDSPLEPPEPVDVRLKPPIDDPQVINTLVNTMRVHAKAIERELADMGFAPSAGADAG